MKSIAATLTLLLASLAIVGAAPTPEADCNDHPQHCLRKREPVPVPAPFPEVDCDDHPQHCLLKRAAIPAPKDANDISAAYGGSQVWWK
ncbi:hypothetical protein ACEPAF_2137 [Sanghuangporus sanghuang]|uniref:Uncharacterized protein n=1 Tax=Sanghuangporus baumii TaxID=108892 RepID=A0A9Q5N474_SANBA|nr:hypothetical protein A7U60_g5150 [Sanghuangporus baumii]